MSEFLPEGESLRRAVQWTSEMRQSDPSLSIKTLINSASQKFDLNPLEEEFLWNTFLSKPS